MIGVISQNGNTQYGISDFVVDNIKELKEIL